MHEHPCDLLEFVAPNLHLLRAQRYLYLLDESVPQGIALLTVFSINSVWDAPSPAKHRDPIAVLPLQLASGHSAVWYSEKKLLVSIRFGK